MEIQNRASLEVLSKAGTFLLASIYAAGFLIVALHHAQYGIAEFSPLKPKIFSAGVLFAVLLCLPAIAAYRLYAPPVRPKADSSHQPSHASWMILSRIFHFYWVSLALAQPWLFLFGGAEPNRLGTVSWFRILVFFLAVVGLIILQRTHLRKFERLSLLASFLVTVALFTAQLRYGDRRIFWLALWFYVVGVATILLFQGLQTPEKIKEIEWEKVAPTFLIVPLSIYATQVYGRIKPSFGGGKPTPVVLHFSAKNPISESAEARVLLIDETDHGYYVLRDEVEKRSYFIRRDVVVGVVFEATK